MQLGSVRSSHTYEQNEGRIRQGSSQKNGGVRNFTSDQYQVAVGKDPFADQESYLSSPLSNGTRRMENVIQGQNSRRKTGGSRLKEFGEVDIITQAKRQQPTTIKIVDQTSIFRRNHESYLNHFKKKQSSSQARPVDPPIHIKKAVKVKQQMGGSNSGQRRISPQPYYKHGDMQKPSAADFVPSKPSPSNSTFTEDEISGQIPVEDLRKSNIHNMVGLRKPGTQTTTVVRDQKVKSPRTALKKKQLFQVDKFGTFESLSKQYADSSVTPETEDLIIVNQLSGKIQNKHDSFTFKQKPKVPPIPLDVLQIKQKAAQCNTEEDAIFSSDDDEFENKLFDAKKAWKQDKQDKILTKKTLNFEIKRAGGKRKKNKIQELPTRRPMTICLTDRSQYQKQQDLKVKPKLVVLQKQLNSESCLKPATAKKQIKEELNESTQKPRLTEVPPKNRRQSAEMQQTKQRSLTSTTNIRVVPTKKQATVTKKAMNPRLHNSSGPSIEEDRLLRLHESHEADVAEFDYTAMKDNSFNKSANLSIFFNKKYPAEKTKHRRNNPINESSARSTDSIGIIEEGHITSKVLKHNVLKKSTEGGGLRYVAKAQPSLQQMQSSSGDNQEIMSRCEETLKKKYSHEKNSEPSFLIGKQANVLPRQPDPEIDHPCATGPPTQRRIDQQSTSPPQFPHARHQRDNQLSDYNKKEVNKMAQNHLVIQKAPVKSQTHLQPQVKQIDIQGRPAAVQKKGFDSLEQFSSASSNKGKKRKKKLKVNNSISGDLSDSPFITQNQPNISTGLNKVIGTQIKQRDSMLPAQQELLTNSTSKDSQGFLVNAGTQIRHKKVPSKVKTGVVSQRDEQRVAVPQESKVKQRRQSKKSPPTLHVNEHENLFQKQTYQFQPNISSSVFKSGELKSPKDVEKPEKIQVKSKSQREKPDYLYERESSHSRMKSIQLPQHDTVKKQSGPSKLLQTLQRPLVDPKSDLKFPKNQQALNSAHLYRRRQSGDMPRRSNTEKQSRNHKVIPGVLEFLDINGLLTFMSLCRDFRWNLPGQSYQVHRRARESRAGYVGTAGLWVHKQIRKQMKQIIIRGGGLNSTVQRRAFWAYESSITKHHKLSYESYKYLASQHPIHTGVIQNDVRRTFPQFGLFKTGQKGRDQLRNILNALSVYEDDKCVFGYTQGLNFVTAMVLMNLDNEVDTFWFMTSLLSKHEFGKVFDFSKVGTFRVLCFQLESLTQVYLPILSEHLKKNKIPTDIYASNWFLTMFACDLPYDVLPGVLDVYLLEGPKGLLRVGLALLKEMEDKLLNMQMADEILEFLSHSAQREQVYQDIDQQTLFSDSTMFKLSNSLLKELERLFRVREKLADIRRTNQKTKRMRSRSNVNNEMYARAGALVPGARNSVRQDSSMGRGVTAPSGLLDPDTSKGILQANYLPLQFFDRLQLQEERSEWWLLPLSAVDENDLAAEEGLNDQEIQKLYEFYGKHIKSRSLNEVLTQAEIWLTSLGHSEFSLKREAYPSDVAVERKISEVGREKKQKNPQPNMANKHLSGLLSASIKKGASDFPEGGKRPLIRKNQHGKMIPSFSIHTKSNGSPVPLQIPSKPSNPEAVQNQHDSAHIDMEPQHSRKGTLDVQKGSQEGQSWFDQMRDRDQIPMKIAGRSPQKLTYHKKVDFGGQKTPKQKETPDSVEVSQSTATFNKRMSYEARTSLTIKPDDIALVKIKDPDSTPKTKHTMKRPMREEQLSPTTNPLQSRSAIISASAQSNVDALYFPQKYRPHNESAIGSMEKVQLVDHITPPGRLSEVKKNYSANHNQKTEQGQGVMQKIFNFMTMSNFSSAQQKMQDEAEIQKPRESLRATMSPRGALEKAMNQQCKVSDTYSSDLNSQGRVEPQDELPGQGFNSTHPSKKKRQRLPAQIGADKSKPGVFLSSPQQIYNKNDYMQPSWVYSDDKITEDYSKNQPVYAGMSGQKCQQVNNINMAQMASKSSLAMAGTSPRAQLSQAMRTTFSEQKKRPHQQKSPIIEPPPSQHFALGNQNLKLCFSSSGSDPLPINQPQSCSVSMDEKQGHSKSSVHGEANIGGDADEEEFPTSVRHQRPHMMQAYHTTKNQTLRDKHQLSPRAPPQQLVQPARLAPQDTRQHFIFPGDNDDDFVAESEDFDENIESARVSSGENRRRPAKKSTVVQKLPQYNQDRKALPRPLPVPEPTSTIGGGSVFDLQDLSVNDSVVLATNQMGQMQSYIFQDINGKSRSSEMKYSRKVGTN